MVEGWGLRIKDFEFRFGWERDYLIMDFRDGEFWFGGLAEAKLTHT